MQGRLFTKGHKRASEWHLVVCVLLVAMLASAFLG